jgi:hypothetical protein
MRRRHLHSRPCHHHHLRRTPVHTRIQSIREVKEIRRKAKGEGEERRGMEGSEEDEMESHTVLVISSLSLTRIFCSISVPDSGLAAIKERKE